MTASQSTQVVARTTSHPRFVQWFSTLILALGVFFVLSEWGTIREAISKATWTLVPYSLATTLISYVCISSSFARISRLLKVEMSVPDLMRVGFISVVLNHVVATGGAAGYSVRYALMREHGVGLPRVLAVSVLHFIFTSMAMIGMLPLGLLYLMLNAAIPAGVSHLLAGAAALVFLVSGLVMALVFSAPVRARVLEFVERRAHSLLRDKLGPTLRTFDSTITEAIGILRDQPWEFVRIMFLITIDWLASAATVWLAFRSLGVNASVGMVVSGYVIGTIAGVASLVPGGLGVQEGSMAGVFALLGVNFNQSVLAAVIYRAIYFLLPYLVSLAVYQWFLRQPNFLPAASEVKIGPPRQLS